MENQSLDLDQQAVDALRESAKWSMFLSILGFIGVGLLLIAAIFMGSVMTMITGAAVDGLNPLGAIKGIISVVYLVFAVIYFIPVYYLFKYASGMKNALNVKDSNLVSNAFVNLKQHHKILGIMVIVIISIYIVIFVALLAFVLNDIGGSNPF